MSVHPAQQGVIGGAMSGQKADAEKLEKLVELTKEAKEVADEIGRPVARAAYHLEAARVETETAIGNKSTVLPRGRRPTAKPD